MPWLTTIIQSWMQYSMRSGACLLKLACGRSSADLLHTPGGVMCPVMTQIIHCYLL